MEKQIDVSLLKITKIKKRCVLTIYCLVVNKFHHTWHLKTKAIYDLPVSVGPELGSSSSGSCGSGLPQPQGLRSHPKAGGAAGAVAELMRGCWHCYSGPVGGEWAASLWPLPDGVLPVGRRTSRPQEHPRRKLSLLSHVSEMASHTLAGWHLVEASPGVQPLKEKGYRGCRHQARTGGSGGQPPQGPRTRHDTPHLPHG